MICVIAAMELEVEKLISLLESRAKQKINGYDIYTGDINKRNIVIGIVGVGKVSAAICTQIIVNKFEVKYILNLGISGGLAKEIELGDVVIASKVTYHDVRSVQMKRFFPFVEWFNCEEYNKLNYSDYKFSIKNGAVVSGDSFIDNGEKKKMIIEKYNPLAVDMEAGAIANVAYIFKVPFICIKGISDKADDKAENDYIKNEKRAAENVQVVMIDIIKNI